MKIKDHLSCKETERQGRPSGSQGDPKMKGRGEGRVFELSRNKKLNN